MTAGNPVGLERSRQELAAARLLVANGFPAQAVSRAYYAAFYAAEEALLRVDEVRSKHGGVVAAIGRLLVVQRGLDADAGRLLRPYSTAAAAPTTKRCRCRPKRVTAP